MIGDGQGPWHLELHVEVTDDGRHEVGHDDGLVVREEHDLEGGRSGLSDRKNGRQR